jgi:hypothetical protein
MEIVNYIQTYAGLIIVIGGAVGVIFKAVKSSNNDLKGMIEKMDKNQCIRELVNFMADVKHDIPKTEVQIKLAKDTYRHYTGDLKGNSYISDEWEELKSKNLI